jgi:PII-like signaling protein
VLLLYTSQHTVHSSTSFFSAIVDFLITVEILTASILIGWSGLGGLTVVLEQKRFQFLKLLPRPKKEHWEKGTAGGI